MSRTILQKGDTAPHFALRDSSNRLVSSSDFLGRRIIVYFYPAAATPGCTAQACDFRDNVSVLRSAELEVIGISRDTEVKLAEFAVAYGLKFPLLSDPDLEVHNAYGAYGEKSMYGKTVTGVIRSTFVIDGKGIIEHALYNVKATGHVGSLKKLLGL